MRSLLYIAAAVSLAAPALAFSTVASLPCHPTAKASGTLRSSRLAVPALRMSGGTEPKATQTAEEIHNRQWELNMKNFRASWECDMNWYTRSSDATTTNQDLWLHIPSEERKDVSYAISFSDEDTGIWDGKGLLFAPNGQMKLDLSRAGYNGGPGSGGNCLQFPGLGGQSAPVMNPTAADISPKCGHEINFFYGRSRSMIVALWALDAAGKEPVLRLSSVGIAPFRDGLAEASTREPKVRTCGRPGTGLDMVQAFKGWTGVRDVYTRQVKPEGNVVFTPRPVTFDLDSYTKAPACHRFTDNLIFAGPEVIDGKGPFELIFGCQPADNLYKQLTIAFDGSGTLVDWTLDQFSPNA